MIPPSRFLLPFNDTTIAFLHPEDTGVDAPYATQITIKPERPADVGTMSTYFLAQHEISELVLRLVSAHIRTKPPSRIIFEGDRYTLIATRRRWLYGREKIRLMWGDENVTPCRYKWTFVFDIKHKHD